MRFWHSHTRGRTVSQSHWTGTWVAIVMCTDIAMVTSLLLSLWWIPTVMEHNTQPERGRYTHTHTCFLQMLLCEWHLFPGRMSFLPVQEVNPVKHGSRCVQRSKCPRIKKKSNYLKKKIIKWTWNIIFIGKCFCLKLMTSSIWFVNDIFQFLLLTLHILSPDLSF